MFFDIYCLFYEKGATLLAENAVLCFITSNKWMRAGYGEKLRTFLAKQTQPKLLIDFAGIKVFENATVDTNILLFTKKSDKQSRISRNCCLRNVALPKKILQISWILCVKILAIVNFQRMNLG